MRIREFDRRTLIRINIQFYIYIVFHRVWAPHQPPIRCIGIYIWNAFMYSSHMAYELVDLSCHIKTKRCIHIYLYSIYEYYAIVRLCDMSKQICMWSYSWQWTKKNFIWTSEFGTRVILDWTICSVQLGMLQCFFSSFFRFAPIFDSKSFWEINIFDSNFGAENEFSVH